MDYEALKAEISLSVYDGMDDQAVADALNAKTVDAVRDVPTADVRGVLLSTGEWGGIVLLGRSAPSETLPAQLIAAAITAEDTLRLTETLESSKPDYWAAMQQLIGAIQSAGVISEATAEKLLTMRDIKISRATELGLPPVTPSDVQTARLV